MCPFSRITDTIEHLPYFPSENIMVIREEVTEGVDRFKLSDHKIQL